MNKVLSLFAINNVLNNNLVIIERFVSSSFVQQRKHMSIKVQKLEFKEFGDPEKVLNLVESTCQAKPQNKEVLIKFLLVPVNPADINTIQGVYPIKPTLPGVPGNEGVAEVIAVGSEAKEFQMGNRVICNYQPACSWRSHALVNESDLLKVPEGVGSVEAAGVSSNPATAYRMLRDFAQLSPGDTVVQNGGNSAVGQSATQLAAAWGLRLVSVVRDRPDIQALRDHLTALGAAHVLTEQEIERQRDFFQKNSLQKPGLALNCVGGKSALTLVRNLKDNGVMVTYGGMSREPVSVPTSSFIFKNVSLHGFWMTGWHLEHRGSDEQKKMYAELFELFQNGKLKAPVHKIIPLSQYKEAIANTMNVKGFAGVKYYFEFSS